MYVSDKYKEAMANINEVLERNKSTQFQSPPHSKEYQTLLKEEIRLLEEQKNLIENEKGNTEVSPSF
ncbi:hypothetical protein [Bacillus sp. AG4(2022)]|uniref:hypothetical protein n=1 Tax=Bacillus sp. AG4(2022) TaxID=2962594 RepID=UPI002880CECF|nr:hypothetical protein [Bacillus sp. AG4(2022)]MDT0160452.1 hypothetical protein [Bacillus sp. AG4(2022)]